MPRIGAAGSVIAGVLETAIQHSKEIYPLISMYSEDLVALHLPILGVVNLLDLSHFGQCVLLPYCEFNLIFPDELILGNFSYFLAIFLCEVPI